MATATSPVAQTDALPADPHLDALRDELDGEAQQWAAVSAEVDAWRDQHATVDQELRGATTEAARRKGLDRRRELRLRAEELPDEMVLVAGRYATALEAWARAAHRFAVEQHNTAVDEAAPLLAARARAQEKLSPSRPTSQRDEAKEEAARTQSKELTDRLQPILARRDTAHDLANEARKQLRDRFGDDVGREGPAPLTVNDHQLNTWLDGVRRFTRGRLTG